VVVVAETIALFPLSHVLLPGMPLPLHIFEQRYRDLVDDIDADPRGRSFGVVALRSGTEARTRFVQDGHLDVETVGTLAEVLDLDRSADGTSDLLCVGSRRFAIRELVTEGKAYLRASVDFLPEATGDLAAGQEQRARELIEVYDDVLARLAGRATGDVLPDDANQLSFEIGARLPLAPADRQALLADTDAGTRLTHVGQLLRRELALLRGTRSIAVSPAVLRIATGAN
jgi:Lon protease-like protein